MNVFKFGSKANAPARGVIASAGVAISTAIHLTNDPDTITFRRFPLASDPLNHIADANDVLGEAHARRLARTTPVVPLKGLQAQTIQIELRKVRLEDGSHNVALFIDGKPWTFQPSSHQPEFLGEFFPAHDIHRHFLLRRDRTVNLTHPTAEYLTGQVEELRPPRLAQMWDGFIANFADNLPKKASFDFLEEAVLKLKNSPQLPVGTSIRLAYYLPPPDIAYQDSGKKANLHLGLLEKANPISNIRHYSAAEIRKHHARLSNLPGVMLEKVGSYERFHIPTDQPGFTKVWEFTRTFFGYEDKITQYWVTRDGKKLNEAQFQHIRDGLPPDAHLDGYDYYLNFNPQTGQYIVEALGDQHQGFQKMNGSPLSVLEPVYTGHPYQPVSIQSISVHAPDGAELSGKANPLNLVLFDYKKAFNIYQKNIQDLLEKGHIPVTLAPHLENKTLLDLLREAIQENKLPPDTPPTMAALLNALSRAYYEFPPELFPNEQLNVTPFPPPPYAGKHFQPDS